LAGEQPDLCHFKWDSNQPKKPNERFSKSNLQERITMIKFHDLRHTAALLMINRGIPIVVVSKILGHSKPRVTLNFYAHCVSESQFKAAKVMEEITTPIAIDLKDIPQEIEK